MSAALLRRAPRTWRSRQLTLMFSCPPTNHFACGGCQSSTVSHGRDHSSSPAIRAQNPSGSRSASAYRLSSRTSACARNSGGRRKRAIFAKEIGKLSADRVGHSPILRGKAGFSAAERREPRTNLGGKLAVGRSGVSEERSILVDSGGGIAALVGNDGKVVMRAGVGRIEPDSALQQFFRVARRGRPRSAREQDSRAARRRMNRLRAQSETLPPPPPVCRRASGQHQGCCAL